MGGGGRQFGCGRQCSSSADEIWVRLEFLKASCRLECSISTVGLAKVQCCFSKFDALLMLFQVNTATRLFYGG